MYSYLDDVSCLKQEIKCYHL